MTLTIKQRQILHHKLYGNYVGDNSAWDSTPYDGHGTINGTGVTSSNTGGPLSSGYISFSAAGDYVQVNNNSYSPQEFQISLWVYPTELDTTTNNDWRHLIKSSTDNFLILEEDGSVSFRVPGVTGVNFKAGNVPLNQWTHISCFYNQSDRAIYVNGNLAGVDSVGSGTVNLGTLRINNDTETFIGRMADVRLANIMMRYKDMQQIANMRFPEDTNVPYLEDLEVFYNFTGEVPSEGIIRNKAYNKFYTSATGVSATHSTDSLTGLDSLDFNGTGNRITPNWSGSEPLGAEGGRRSIEMVFNPDTTTGRSTLWEEGGRNSGVNMYILDGILYAGVWDENFGWNGTWLSVPVNTSTWYHAIFTYHDTNGLMLYLNGSEVASAVPTNLGTLGLHTGDAQIGAQGSSSKYHDIGDDATSYTHYFDGKLDIMRYWLRELSADEVSGLYNDAVEQNVFLNIG